MGVLAPWFLGGLLAVGLPIWLHLLQQHRVDPHKFPSLQFFERRTESSVRQRRLKYKFLMALRLLMLILLALLFAQPFIRKNVAGALQNRHTVLIVDNSFSMRAGNKLEQARSAALNVVNQLNPGTSAQIVTLGGGAHLLTQSSTDKAELASALASIKPGDSRSSFAEVPRILGVISESRRLPIELHVFSDFQKTSMPSSFQELALPSGTTFTAHAVGASEPNFAVESVNAPTVVSDPKAVRLTATVAANGTTEESKRSVQLVSNGKVLQSKTVTIPAGGRGTVEFIGFDASYGWNRGEVRLDGSDALPADNVMRFAVERSDPRKVLFVHDPARGRGALYFRAALESAAGALFSLELASPEQAANLDPSRYALVVLSDIGPIPEAFETKLKNYITAGGGLWIAAGATTATRGAVPFTGAKITRTRFAAGSAERFFSPSGLDISHPSVANANRWEGVRIYQASAIEPGSARVVVRLNDGTPLLFDERLGEGRIVTFASGFENISNDFPLHASFVPFVEQTARYLAQVELRPSALPVDAFLELRIGGAEGAAAVEVVDPHGQRLLNLKDAATAQALRVEEEGFYEIGRQNNRRELVAVNADRAESDLAPIPEESLKLWQGTGVEQNAPGAAVENEQRRPVSLWWWFALAVLIVTLVESFVASRHLNPETAPS